MVNSIQGIVNGHKADIIIDTGAQITIVLGKFIYKDNLTGDTVSILGVNGNPTPYQTATIPITIQDTTLYETVAVAPEHQLNAKILLSAPIDSITTQNLLDSYFNKQKHNNTIEVKTATRSNTTTTPAVKYYSDNEESEVEADRASDLSYQPESDTSSLDGDETNTNTSFEDESLGQAYAPPDKHLNSLHLPSSPDQTHNQTLNPHTEPYSSTPLTEPYSSTPLTEPYSSTSLTEPNSSIHSNEPSSSPPPTELHSSTPPTEPYSSTPLTEPYSSTKHITHNQLDGSIEQPVLIPDLPIKEKGTNTEKLKGETKTDPTLKIIKGLAHHNKKGYTWDNGLLYHLSLDPTMGERKRFVVPQSQRHPLIEIAHDRSGHFSAAKTRATLNNRFTWPKMGTEIQSYILACVKCKEYNKVAHKQAPLYTRPTITEPHQEVALDIIGPLPRSKQGYRFALTAICMASRWPEVYPLKNTEAKSVTNALVEFIARNGIPSKILTDQGSQFTSAIMAQTCQTLGITHIKTVPYRPQGNGVLERFHGTLKPLLAKAVSDGGDWVTFLPLALSAIRAIPCRSTGFSPAELLFGRNNHGFLDVVYEGWTNTSYSSVDVSTWIQQLNDKLEILRDSATLHNHQVREKQNTHKPNAKTIRVYKPDDLVFTRIPGCRANLQASWEGPFKITKHIPPLNYEVQDLDKTWSKVTHINNLRSYQPLPEVTTLKVDAACLVAEETAELSEALGKTPSLVGGPCLGYSQQELDELLDKNNDVFSPTPGEAQVDSFKIQLQEDAVASSRPPYQVPIHLRGDVNKEIDKLVENNIIEPSSSVDWCAGTEAR